MDVGPEQSAVDTCFVCLPKEASAKLGVQPNMEDLNGPKDMWLGRVSQLRELLGVCSTDLAFLEPVASVVAGFAVFMHGSVGIAKPNLRFMRMIGGMGYLVLAPDSMANSKRRTRSLLASPIAADANTDYWSDNLVYTSAAEGELEYSSSPEKILADTEKWKDLMEAVYQERACDLQSVLLGLPDFMNDQGVFLVGSSEGSVTTARFDESVSKVPVRGRFLTSCSLEYCYFTPKEENALIGGSKSIPTVNVVGDKDPFFGSDASVAMKVAADPAGYGASPYTGNAFRTLCGQGVGPSLVAVLDSNIHDLTKTHDSFLRQLLRQFLADPTSCRSAGDAWSRGGINVDVEVVESTEGSVLLRIGALPAPAA